MGTPLGWPYDTLPDTEARRQSAGAASTEAFSASMSRSMADDQAFAIGERNTAAMSRQLVTYVGAQALLGSDPTLAASILAQRSAGGQPQSGGGPGQPVNFPVQQQLPTQQQPGVYIFNPTTGQLSKQ